MRVERLSQRATRLSPLRHLLRQGWRVGFALLGFALLLSRGASAPVSHPIHLGQHPLGVAGSLGPTAISCSGIQAGGTVTWDAEHSPYILPYNVTNDPVAGDINACANFPVPVQNSPPPSAAPGVVVPPGTKLIIDATDGPVQIFSHGAGIFDEGGQIVTQGTGLSSDGTYHTVTFDAEPDVASWDGIWITNGTLGGLPQALGAANLDYTSVQHALTAISIDSGATSFAGYGLVFTNGAIGPSYFDGIDSTNTPVQMLGQGEGRFGTVNNIGSQGLNLTFTKSLSNALDVEKEVFGSSVPFADTTCIPLQPCAAGTIGNNAIEGTFAAQTSIVISGSSFYRAGSFGVDLENIVHPQIVNNYFVCNGSGSPTPLTSCTPPQPGSTQSTPPRYSAIYLNNVTADLPDDASQQFPPLSTDHPATGISNNFGQQNGLDALVLSGQVNANGTGTSNVNWKTPTNSSSQHALGFLIGNIAGTGGLQLNQTSLTVKSGDVVKVIGGGITLNGGTLNAGDNGFKTFTSMRDNSLPATQAVWACPSIFVQSCPSALPIPGKEKGLSGAEWSGIKLMGATASFNHANILFATNAVTISGTPTSSYNLQLTNSFVGPTFSDSVVVKSVPALIQSTKFCRIDPTIVTLPGGTLTENCFASANPGDIAGPGARGINADNSVKPPTVGNGLQVIGNDFEGSANEAILGTALSGWPIVVETNTVNRAGAYGIQLAGSDNLTLEANTVNQSGFGSPLTYPAIYLNDVRGANFDNSTAPTPPLSTAQLACSPNCIRWNSGSANAINAIAFHGTSSSLNWIKPTNAAGPLGYLLDDSLAVTGNLSLSAGDVVEVGHPQATLTVSGELLATGALVTSFKDLPSNLPPNSNFPSICGSVFDPLVLTSSGSACPTPAAGDWGGLVLTSSAIQSTMTDTVIRYADTGILANGPLSVLRGAISFTTAEGIRDYALTTTQQVRIEDVAVDHAGTYGIHLVPATNLNGGYIRLVGNQVTNSGTGTPRYPAIDLGLTSYGNVLPPQGTASTTCIQTTVGCVQGNLGGGNGVNALVFHGTMGTELDWVTPQNAPANQPQQLGYVLDGTLNMGGNQLTVRAGDVVKVAPSSLIDMAGGVLSADNTDSAIQKVFTTLADNNAGISACPSVLISDCSLTAGNYWSGILMEASTYGPSTATANGSVVNANIRYATTGIDITSGAGSTIGSSSFGLVVSHSSIGPESGDAIDTIGTSISVTNSTISNAVHGIDADLTNASSTPSLFLTGNRFSSTGAEAILGQALTGRPVWLSDNHITASGTFGIRLLGPDHLVMRNNNVSTSGTGSVIYPAIDLSSVTANLTTDVRGNVGQGNGINAILLDGTAEGDVAWKTPQPTSNPATLPLGYMLDGPLTLQGGNLSVGSGDVVKGLGGAVTINGGTLTASGGSGTATFTSVKDPGSFASCPSFLAACGAAPGDWGGLVLTGGAGGTIDHALINYAATGISTDSGPLSSAAPHLKVTYTTIVNTKQDGINSLDTPIDVENSSVGDSTMANTAGNNVVLAPTPNIGRYGIIASFLSPPDCPAGCQRLRLLSNTVASTANDGIAATGLGGQPVDIEHNTVTGAGTYGISLVGADNLTLIANTVTTTGTDPGGLTYPAIYLNGVKADIEKTGSGAIVQGNHGWGNGLDAIVLHGEADNNLNWLTAASAPVVADDAAFGYLLDGSLTVDGTLTTNAGDEVKVLNGGIKINPLNGVGGSLNTTGKTIFTSLKDSDPTHGLVACGSVLVPVACPSTPTSSDWTGINIDAGTSYFTNGALLYATNGISITGASLNVSGAEIVGVSGTALASSGPQSLTVDCSSIRQNGTGIKADYATITHSDIYANGTDLNGNNNLHAKVDDYLGAKTTTADAATISSQYPVVTTLSLTSDNPVSGLYQSLYPAFGTGDMHLTATFNRKMDMTIAPDAAFGSNHHMDATGLTNNGWSTDQTTWTWTPKPYDLELASISHQATAEAGGNALKLTNGRDCIPPETDTVMPVQPNKSSNLMVEKDQTFGASILPTVLVPSPSGTAPEGPYGGSAQLQAHLTANGVDAPSQTVNFSIDGNPVGGRKTDNTGFASINASLAGLNAGTHQFSVSFGGDPNQFFTPAPPATGLPITATLTVDPAQTTTSAPTSTLASSTYGQAVSLSATVTTNVSGGINPGSSDGTVIFRSGATTICSASLGTGGSTNAAKCTTSTLAAATTPYAVNAVYTPSNGNFVTSTSATTINQTVSQASTTTATPTSDTNPSTYGQTIKLSAQVTSSYLNPGSADGSVAFTEGTTTICSAALGTGSSTDEAACTTNQLAQGTHTITATFTPANGNYGGSSAATTLTQTVSAAVTTTATPTSSLNPSTTAQSVTLSATVTATHINPGSSDGSVAFKEGATTLCSANLGTGASNNAASCSYTFTTTGPHTITAVFTASDANFSDSTSAGTLTQTVNP